MSRDLDPPAYQVPQATSVRHYPTPFPGAGPMFLTASLQGRPTRGRTFESPRRHAPGFIRIAVPLTPGVDATDASTAGSSDSAVNGEGRREAWHQGARPQVAHGEWEGVVDGWPNAEVAAPPRVPRHSTDRRALRRLA